MSLKKIIEKLVSIYKTFYLFDGKKHIRKPLSPFYWNSGQVADSNHADKTGKDRPGCGNAILHGADMTEWNHAE